MHMIQQIDIVLSIEIILYFRNFPVNISWITHEWHSIAYPWVQDIGRLSEFKSPGSFHIVVGVFMCNICLHQTGIYREYMVI